MEGPLGSTDLKSWNLDSSDLGRHFWRYARKTRNAWEPVWGPDAGAIPKEQSKESKYWLGLPIDTPESICNENPHTPGEAAEKGMSFYEQLQSPDGHFSGEYGGPLFLLPGVVIAMYITQIDIPNEWRIEISRYLKNVQRDHGEKDEGWGLHIEGHSTIFGTALNYVTLRLLGVDKNEPMMVKARKTLLDLGGATGIPSWGKFWLALMNLYDWRGVNSMMPELHLLPPALPIHPHRWWIHTRAVYVPMGYLYGIRYQTKETQLIRDLREEIFVEKYDSINWDKQRNNINQVDMYSPHSKVADALFGVLSVYEQYIPDFIRKPALRKAYNFICMEDDNTTYQTVGPVSKPMHMIVRWLVDGPGSKAFQMHVSRVRDFMWMSDRGMMMTGTNGSQLWDTAFIAQAASEGGLIKKHEECCTKMLDWLDKTQILYNPPHYHSMFRQSTIGAWPFSTKEQGYTVSDCTAEGLRAVIMLQEELPAKVSEDRMKLSIDLILSMQNATGGWASYELRRASTLMELLNPAEVFANIMVEYDYPECTTACITALSLFQQKISSEYRRDDIIKAIEKGRGFILSVQRPDGSFYGSWAVCFTYATMFAIDSLCITGSDYSNLAAVKKACEFLVSKQREDGSWGESFASCETHVYTQSSEGQSFNTAWALLGLMYAHYPHKDVIRRGVEYLMRIQQHDGSWLPGAVEGVFNKNCAISYPNYKFAWTIRALGLAEKYLKEP